VVGVAEASERRPVAVEVEAGLEQLAVVDRLLRDHAVAVSGVGGRQRPVHGVEHLDLALDRQRHVQHLADDHVDRLGRDDPAGRVVTLTWHRRPPRLGQSLERMFYM